MLAIDMHLDLAMGAYHYNRDLKQPVAENRRREEVSGPRDGHVNTVAFPEMRRGRVAANAAPLLARSHPDGGSIFYYRAPEIAYGMAQGQLAYFRRLQADGTARLIGDWPALAAHLEDWRRDPDHTPFGFIITMEGADAITAPDTLPGWRDDGLRIIALVHYGVGRYAGGTGAAVGLTDLGRGLLRAMDELGLVLDLTHLSDASFWEAVEHFRGPVLASHSTCRALVPGDRQLTDDQLRVLIQRDGVVGVGFLNNMVHPEFQAKRADRTVVNLGHVVDHIDRICQLAGTTRHVAIGTDFDGGCGLAHCPAEIDTIADLQKFPAVLRARGYSEPDVAAFFHGNWLRLLERAWSTPR